MATEATEPVLIVSPRYADEVAGAVMATGMIARIERRPQQAAGRFEAEPARLVVVDARGALAQGLGVARALGAGVQSRLGAMLVLLSRSDGDATSAAHDAGATGVLVSPFGRDAFANALRLTVRHAQRLEEAASGTPEAGDAQSALARHDPLTGLATGSQLQQWTAMLLGLPHRDAKPVIVGAPRTAPALSPMFVIALGVGRFAQINAAYGRDVADQVLSAVALRLGQIVDARKCGNAASEARLLARLAAAEFAVAMGGGTVELQDATQLAQQLVQAFETPFVVGDHVIHLSGRAGIAGREAGLAVPAEEEAAALIRRANSALVTARAGEAGAVEVFRPNPAGDPRTRMADLESDLHRAIDAGDISLLFQPQLALASGEIAGVEALVRWEHPVLGLLPAETLLETAASAELAVRLGRHIRARAMAMAAGWSGPLAMLKISLNVTAADLADPGFLKALEVALSDSGLERDRLVLEVTEGAIIEDMRGAARLLEGLRKSGVSVALDDFGTGYSSLAWMARLPIDSIKLDRSFMLGLTGSAREQLVVETVVRMSRQLGLTVVAEGVEDDIQMAASRKAGCDAVQGYRIAPPMDVNALRNFCQAWPLQALAS